MLVLRFVCLIISFMGWTEYRTPQARIAIFSHRYGRNSLEPLHDEPSESLGHMVNQDKRQVPMPGPVGPLVPTEGYMPVTREPMPGPLGPLASKEVIQLGSNALDARLL